MTTGFNLGKYGYNSVTRPISKKEKNQIKTAFTNADEQNKGYLAREDVKVAVAELFGYKPSKYDVDQIMEKYGKALQGQKVLTLGPFSDAMETKFAQSDEEEFIRHTFMTFDSQCRGFLTLEDLNKAAQKVSPNLKPSVLETAFRELDRDGDGRISFKDFDFMMKYNTDDHI